MHSKIVGDNDLWIAVLALRGSVPPASRTLERLEDRTHFARIGFTSQLPGLLMTSEARQLWYLANSPKWYLTKSPTHTIFGQDATS